MKTQPVKELLLAGLLILITILDFYLQLTAPDSTFRILSFGLYTFLFALVWIDLRDYVARQTASVPPSLTRLLYLYIGVNVLIVFVELLSGLVGAGFNDDDEALGSIMTSFAEMIGLLLAVGVAIVASVKLGGQIQELNRSLNRPVLRWLAGSLQWLAPLAHILLMVALWVDNSLLMVLSLLLHVSPVTMITLFYAQDIKRYDAHSVA